MLHQIMLHQIKRHSLSRVQGQQAHNKARACMVYCTKCMLLASYFFTQWTLSSFLLIWLVPAKQNCSKSHNCLTLWHYAETSHLLLKDLLTLDQFLTWRAPLNNQISKTVKRCCFCCPPNTAYCIFIVTGSLAPLSFWAYTHSMKKVIPWKKLESFLNDSNFDFNCLKMIWILNTNKYINTNLRKCNIKRAFFEISPKI